MAKAVNIVRSHRLDGIGEYYFSRRLREIAEIEAATGRQIVKLAMGSPDLPPHQSVIDRLAKEAQRPDVHKYMSYQGEPILRKAFADWYKKWYHVDLDFKSEVYPLIGSKEGIMHICMTFLNPGDKVLVPNPGYPTYSAGVKLAGGVMVPYALNKQTNFYPDFEAIEKAGLDGVKMMLVNYPNMPTGQVGSMELFEKIIDFGAKHNILIVHDNPYSFIRNSAGPLSIMAVEGAKEVALELNSLSKGHSMAGWRVGVLVGKAEWLKDVMTFRSNMDSGMFYPIQAASETALSLGEEWYWPSINEVVEIFGVYNGLSYEEAADENGKYHVPDEITDEEKAARAAFDLSLTTYGGDAMNTAATSANGDRYWSSTEYVTPEGDKAYGSFMVFGKAYMSVLADQAGKTNASGGRYVRCIRVISNE